RRNPLAAGRVERRGVWQLIRVALGRPLEREEEGDRAGKAREAEAPPAVALVEREGRKQPVEDLRPGDDGQGEPAEDREQDGGVREGVASPDRERDEQETADQADQAQGRELDGKHRRDGQERGQRGG